MLIDNLIQKILLGDFTKLAKYFTNKTKICYQSLYYKKIIQMYHWLIFINSKPSDNDKKCKCTKIYLTNYKLINNKLQTSATGLHI